MKKYVKPELFYEQFELTTHIADCAWELQFSSDTTCYAQFDPSKGALEDRLFMSSEMNCSVSPGSGYQAYCYHDGTNGINVFAS